jgi:hypothetical protein
MRKAASMFIFLVLGTACIIDLEPAETDIVERGVSAGDRAGDGRAELGAMATRGESLRPDEVAPGAGIAGSQACPWCSF